MLTPLAIDPSHPFPFLPNQGFAVGFTLHRQADGLRLRALVPIPTHVERFIELPVSPDGRRFIALARWAADPEAIIRARFKRLSRSLLAARGPPQLHALLGTLQSPRKRKLPGSPPLARHPQPAYPPSHVHARRHPSTSRQGHSTPCAGASLTMAGRRRKRRRPSSRPALR